MKQVQIRRSALLCFAVLVFMAGASCGDTFRIDLPELENLSIQYDTITAGFNLGRGLSRVDAVRIRFEGTFYPGLGYCFNDPPHDLGDSIQSRMQAGGGTYWEATSSYMESFGAFAVETLFSRGSFQVPTWDFLLDGQAAVETRLEGLFPLCTIFISMPRAYITTAELIIEGEMEDPIEVLSPNGGEIIEAGTVHTIEWTDFRTPGGCEREYLLSYSVDDGANWEPVDVNVVSGTCTYDWQVPQVNSLLCLIKVEDANEAYAWDVSDEFFAIIRVTYHVDGADGNDMNDGLTKETAFATIQKGVDEANDTDTVLVWPGVYTESIYFTDKAITVRSAADAAIIEADSIYGVSFNVDEGKVSVLKNFVIRNSDAGIYVSTGSPTISNVTIVDNLLGIDAEEGADPCISNCILWNNGTDLWNCDAKYSCVEQGSGGLGNISYNPLFVDANGGNYRLLSEGWRWDSIAGRWSFDYATSRCIDAGNPGCPLGDELISVPGDPDNFWGVNLRINMGAYGGTSQASMAPHGWAYLGDLTNDRRVDIDDFVLFTEYWLASDECIPSDLDRDTKTDFGDYSLFAADWGKLLPCDIN